MTAYDEFFLGSHSDVVQLELMSIVMDDEYHVVRNAKEGVTVTLENGRRQEFMYYPLRFTPVGTKGDLDYGLRVELGDLGEIIPKEVEAFRLLNRNSKPRVVYRVYRSDDLSEPMFGPLNLEITNVTMTRDGSAFDAQAPVISVLRTGSVYGLNRFPMLRGTL